MYTVYIKKSTVYTTGKAIEESEAVFLGS